MTEKNRKTPVRRKSPATAKRASSKRSNKQVLLTGGILAAVFVLLLGIYLGMNAAQKGEHAVKPKTETPLESVQKEVVTKDNESAGIEEAEKALKLAMFNNNISNDAIKSRSMTEGSIPIVTYVITLPKNEQSAFINELSQAFEKLGFKTDNEEGFDASNEKCSIHISFEEGKSVQPKNEPITTLPANAPKLAIIVDDCGYSISLAKRLAAIKYPVTFAILPYLPYDSETAEIARKGGKTVFLHFPMEPLAYPNTDPGKGAILLNMPPSIIEVQADNNVKQIGKIDGFNNHMGSAFTEDEKKMRQVLSFMKKYTDTYVDSYTTGKSEAYKACLDEGMNCAQNRKFIDNEHNETYIRKKVMEAVELAKKNGSTVMIGHLKEETVSVLEKHLVDVEKAGVRIVSIKELTHKK